MTTTVSKKKIQICALMLTPYDIHPGQRLRLEQWEPYLLEDGIQIDHFPLLDQEMLGVMYKEGNFVSKMKGVIRATFRRLRQILKSNQYDAVYLYRTANIIGPAIFERFLKIRKTPVIYDFDDSIFLTDTSEANRLFGWLKFSGKTSKICELSDVVTVGNSYLQDYARQFNDEVRILPTSIDTEKYRPVNKGNVDRMKTVIGWTGTSTSQYHLEAFEPVLTRVLENPSVELLVISDRNPSFKRIGCRWVPWSSERELEITSMIDIGIMPIPDDAWSRGKCAAKALQYMALGIPAVCSNVGANIDLIDHGKNGFLAKTDDDWVEFLNALADDSEMRRKIGIVGRQTVVDRYSMRHSAGLFGNIVKKVATVQKG